LPEIKPAKQEQAVQPRWNSERLTRNWILEIKHFVFFMRSSSGPVSRSGFELLPLAHCL
jgi:hypothetical protein